MGSVEKGWIVASGALLAPVLLATACAGDGILETGPINTVCEPATGAAAVSFANDLQPVFDLRCSFVGCHGGAAQQRGLSLEAGDAYGLLVCIPSDELPEFLRVNPGDPENSYLLMKLAGDPRIEPERMPLGGPFLDEAAREPFLQWIAAGAPDN